MIPPDPFSELLQSWRHRAHEDARFRSKVWSRIEAGRAASGIESIYRWALPLVASAALIVGTGTAIRVARQQYVDHMADAYVRSVDPLQMMASPKP